MAAPGDGNRRCSNETANPSCFGRPPPRDWIVALPFGPTPRSAPDRRLTNASITRMMDFFPARITAREHVEFAPLAQGRSWPWISTEPAGTLSRLLPPSRLRSRTGLSKSPPILRTGLITPSRSDGRRCPAKSMDILHLNVRDRTKPGSSGCRFRLRRGTGAAYRGTRHPGPVRYRPLGTSTWPAMRSHCAWPGKRILDAVAARVTARPRWRNRP